MAKLQGHGKNAYTKAILGNDPVLLNAADGADITDERESALIPGMSTRKVQTSMGTAAVLTNSTSQPEDIEVDEEEGVSEVDTGEEQVDEEETVIEPTYTKDQVQKIVQTRVGTMNSKLEQLKPYKEAFDRISELTGMSVDQLIGRLNGLSVTEQAHILGLKPEEVQSAQQARRDIRKATGEAQSLSRQVEELQLKADKRYYDYDLFKEEIDLLTSQNPKLTLKQAYTLAKGDISASVARDTEQRVINQQVIKRQKAGIRPTGVAPATGPRVDNMIIAAAKQVGMDPLEYAKYIEISNIDQYKAMKKSQKKG